MVPSQYCSQAVNTCNSSLNEAHQCAGPVFPQKLHYTLSRKNLNNLWAFWEHFRTYVLFKWHAEWIKTRSLTSGIVDSRLWIKVMALPIYVYREAICLQCFPPTLYKSGHGQRTWTWRLSPDLLNIGSLVALYGSTVHVALYPGASNSQLCSASHWKACFSVSNIAKLGIGSGDKVNLAAECGDFQIFCLVCQSLLIH